MPTLKDIDARIQADLEVTDQEDGTVLITLAQGRHSHSIMVNKQDLICALGHIQAVPDLFMAVEYDADLDSYVAACSGTFHNTSGEAIREYKDCGRCGVPTIARRHEGMWYIGDVLHERLVM